MMRARFPIAISGFGMNGDIGKPGEAGACS